MTAFHRLSGVFRLAGFVLLAVFAAARAGDLSFLDPGRAKMDSTGLLWYDVREIGVEGKGWTETGDYYDRLPSKAKSVVSEDVWSLSRHSSGLCVRFATDAVSISVSWDGGEGFQHMPATGVSGVDLYGRGEDGTWRYLAVGRPDKERTTRRLRSNLPGKLSQYILYLPLYNRVTRVEIGVPATARLARVPAPAGRPIVFYGTSITQGGCASRPGMAYTAILGRWLDRETINLGFSGNGRMEPEMAGLLAELDPSVYVIDCIPNVDEKIGELTGPLVKIIRARHAETPILMVEDSRPGDAEANRKMRQAVQELQDQGVRNLFVLRGDNLVGQDGEAFVDGRHPSDLGFMRMSEAFRPALQLLLGLSAR
jgi:hypothetical protein